MRNELKARFEGMDQIASKRMTGGGWNVAIDSRLGTGTDNKAQARRQRTTENQGKRGIWNVSRAVLGGLLYIISALLMRRGGEILPSKKVMDRICGDAWNKYKVNARNCYAP
jgi:hypothetical protein